MQAHPGARRSILLSLAIVAAGCAAALYHVPRQRAYAADAQQRARLAQAPRVEVIVDGEMVIQGMTVDARGALYITAVSDDDVYAVSKPGQRSRFTDQGELANNPSRHRSLSRPSTLTADAAGKLYALDASGPLFGCFASPRIKHIAADGKVSALAHADTAMAPHTMGSGMVPIAVDKAGNLYMQEGDATYQLTRTGTRRRQALPDGAADDSFAQHDGALAAHPDGGLVVANQGHGVYRLLPDGRAVRLTTHGGDCSLGSSTARVAQAQRCRIDALAVDADGRIFLSNAARILQVDTDGTISTFFDPGNGTPLPLKQPLQDYGPTLMAPGPHGALYWARFSTLLKFTPWSRMPRL
jgi:hypothetical protein